MTVSGLPEMNARRRYALDRAIRYWIARSRELPEGEESEQAWRTAVSLAYRSPTWTVESDPTALGPLRCRPVERTGRGRLGSCG